MKKPIPRPSITEVVEHYGATVYGADMGGWQKATCPLLAHDDKSPSASIHETNGKWHCWACDKAGDAIDLIQENEGVGFAGAVEIAAGFTSGSSGAVPQDSGYGGSLSRKPRGNQGGGKFVPAWRRL